MDVEQEEGRTERNEGLALHACQDLLETALIVEVAVAGEEYGRWISHLGGGGIGEV